MKINFFFISITSPWNYEISTKINRFFLLWLLMNINLLIDHMAKYKVYIFRFRFQYFCEYHTCHPIFDFRRTRSRSGSYSSRAAQHPKNSSEPRRYYNSHTSNGSASHGSRRGREHRDPTGPRSTVIATEGFEAARW